MQHAKRKLLLHVLNAKNKQQQKIYKKASVKLTDCCNKSDGQGDEQREKPVQNMPTPFRKTQLSPKLLEFQIQ